MSHGYPFLLKVYAIVLPMQSVDHRNLKLMWWIEIMGIVYPIDFGDKGIFLVLLVLKNL